MKFYLTVHIINDNIAFMKRILLILYFSFSVNLLFSQDIIIELIDTNTELNNLNKKINELTNEIKTLITNDEILNIFISQCNFWIRERNNCRNQSNQNYRQLVLNSLRETLIKREQYLARIINDLDLIINEGSIYKFIDPWYLVMFAEEYNGKEIWLFGSLSINKSAIISGKITGFDKNKTEIYVLFYGPSSESIMNLYRLMINDQSVVSYFFGIIGTWNNNLCINILNNIINN